MPPTPLTHRPQTLRQAKKVYRKAGATVRLSESERAVLERRAVLQERADRIKEREARRKANLKRKEERLQREREARHRMGIPTPPAKEGIQVGPSQLHLSSFMYAGVKRKRDDGEEEEKEEKSGIQKEGEPVVQEQQTSPLEIPPSRQPLQLLSANATSWRLTPSQIAKLYPPKVRDFAVQENPASPKRAPVPSKLRPFELNATSEDDCFDDFFVSNTQIQRELSPPPTPPSRTMPNDVCIARLPTPSPPVFKPPASSEDTADLLALISTQDLDFTDEPTQRPPPSPHHSPEPDSDFPDPELEDIVLEFSLESPLLSSNATTTSPEPPHPSPDRMTRSDDNDNDRDEKDIDGDNSPHDSDSDSAAEQAALQTVGSRDYEKEQRRQEAHFAAAEWEDAFGLSTQDLMELES